MPRRPRVFVAGATYHVYCRAARGDAVFSEPAEAADLVEVIRDVPGSGLRCCVIVFQRVSPTLELARNMRFCLAQSPRAQPVSELQPDSAGMGDGHEEECANAH